MSQPNREAEIMEKLPPEVQRLFQEYKATRNPAILAEIKEISDAMQILLGMGQTKAYVGPNGEIRKRGGTRRRRKSRR